MTAAKNIGSKRASTAAKVGLLAFGSSGRWELAIDEATSGPDRWFAQIETDAVWLHFEISSPKIVRKILHFLAAPGKGRNGKANGTHGRSDSLRIGSDKTQPIFLVRDNEYADRFFIVVGHRETPVARIVVKGSDVANLVRALRQVNDDLDAAD